MSQPGLVRTLGTGSAVMVGLGAMLGAGVFAAFAPAAAAAGVGLLAGLVVAAAVAYANAMSSARLAAQLPRSGGAYLYGRELLGPIWGFVAGWGFVIGKTASAAAMALTVASYLAPPGWTRPAAAAVAALAVGVGHRGLTRTTRVAAVLVVVVLAGLAAVLLGAGVAGELDPARLSGGTHLSGVLTAAGLLFFAFAGYARLATLGEEVREPERTIPRAIAIALTTVVGVYALVGFGLLTGLGPDVLARSAAPVAALAERVGPGLSVVARVAAVAASSGALLALLAGLGRTVLAMAREGDLPTWFAAVHPRHRVPYRAELAVGTAVVVLAASTDLRGAIGFSSFGVLVYYVVANLAALRQDPAHRRHPRALPIAGAAGCAVLAVTLPLSAVVAGVTVLAVGVAGRWVVRRLRATPSPPRSP